MGAGWHGWLGQVNATRTLGIDYLPIVRDFCGFGLNLAPVVLVAWDT